MSDRKKSPRKKSPRKKSGKMVKRVCSPGRRSPKNNKCYSKSKQPLWAVCGTPKGCNARSGPQKARSPRVIKCRDGRLSPNNGKCYPKSRQDSWELCRSPHPSCGEYES